MRINGEEVGQTFYGDCKNAPHNGPCRTCAGRAFSEWNAEDRRFWRGLRLSGRPYLPPIYPSYGEEYGE